MMKPPLTSNSSNGSVVALVDQFNEGIITKESSSSTITALSEKRSAPKLYRRPFGPSRMTKSKANASWESSASTPNKGSLKKLSRTTTAVLFGNNNNITGASNSNDDEVNKRSHPSSVIVSTDQLRRNWTDAVEISQLLSMLRSNSFVGAVQPEHHSDWLNQPRSPPETKRQKVAMMRC